MAGSAGIVNRLFSLEGKVALLTGAGGGIGRELALGLADAGASVAIHARSLERLDSIKEEIEHAGGRTVALTAELGSLEQARRLVAEANAAFGRLDVLINCAATNIREPIDSVSEDHWDSIMAVNLKSLYFMSQEARRLMKERKAGKIIHIGSITSTFALGGVSVYGCAKAAVAQLTRVMAVEWAKDNIQVNCVIPGFIRTPLSEPIWRDAYKAEWLRNRIPVRRPAEPEELVGAVLFCASPASSYITGTTITVDGGFEAGGWWEPDETIARL
jgi:2-deoxy-D-gluconate 3-dehydrogenase